MLQGITTPRPMQCCGMNTTSMEFKLNFCHRVPLVISRGHYFVKCCYNDHASSNPTPSSFRTRSYMSCRNTESISRHSSFFGRVEYSREFSKKKILQRKRFRINSEIQVASALEVINDLGLDTMTFFGVTVLVVPAFKLAKASPILGFFFAGVVLNQFGLIRNVTDIKALSEWGILFLLFEMGLELSFARLKALAKFAFGMGLLQVILSTLAFTAFELPINAAVGTRILEFLFHSKSDLVNIRSIDEAVVIGAALSLSSSAFVLQLLADKGELPTRFGSATLGILLMQDIAVVPLLVILPVLEGQNLGQESLWPMLLSESLKALAGLGVLSLGGKFLLRRIFEVVANSRSSEAFIALCLLTVTGTSLITQKLGFSDTLGAFLAGAILAETNYRTQIESDIRPFRGLLLGLFFVTTGTSIDIELLMREWPNVLALLGGLIAIKTLITTAIGPFFGLTVQESVRIGLLLSQGGEFAFVVFSLANRLGVLPLELNRMLIIVVVLSMSLTPLLNEVGKKAAELIDSEFDEKDITIEPRNFNVSEPVVILGFGQMAQVLANFLSTPLVAGLDGDLAGIPYVAFDLDPAVIKTARNLGFPVLYGDGSRPDVLETAGISLPKAVMVMYADKAKSVQSVERLHVAFPSIPIYARAENVEHLIKLRKAGATDVILENAETSLQLGSKLLKGLGIMSDDVSFLSQLMRESMEVQAQEALAIKDDKEIEVMKPLQVKMSDLLEIKIAKDQNATAGEESLANQAKTINNGPMESLNLTSTSEVKNSLMLSKVSANNASNSSLNIDEITSKRVLNAENGVGSDTNSLKDSLDKQLMRNSNEGDNNDDGRGVTWCSLMEENKKVEEDKLDKNMKCSPPVD